jgi:hypothetical protein
MERKLVRWSMIVAILALPMASLADDEYPTNLELLEVAVKAAVDSMRMAPPGIGSPELTVMAGSGADASWLLDSVLKEKLLALGWRIRAQDQDSQPDSADAAGYVLRIQVIDLGLRYGRSWRKFLFAGKMVERIARASIYYELVDSAGDQVLVSSNVRGEKKDVVPASLLPLLADAKYSFASPELTKGQWEKYLEGGLVIAIIGVLVYLFYSNKTAS